MATDHFKCFLCDREFYVGKDLGRAVRHIIEYHMEDVLFEETRGRRYKNSSGEYEARIDSVTCWCGTRSDYVGCVLHLIANPPWTNDDINKTYDHWHGKSTCLTTDDIKKIEDHWHECALGINLERTG